MSENGILLKVSDLSVSFFAEEGQARAVQQVSFDIQKGKTFALVGESGCGKSVTAFSIMRLIPDPPGKIISGEIAFKQRNLLKFSEKQMRAIRGNQIAMIFQEPMTSLNPVYTVGDQIVEAIQLHKHKDINSAWADAVDVLKQVGIPDPEQRVYDYPHQMSGGMRQRVMIAMAISCRPHLLIADEPTTALDVTIQAQILDLLDELQRQHQMSMMLITHDLAVVAERADHTAVMYASRIAESAATAKLLSEPQHPYTQGLLKSLPSLGTNDKRLYTIPGTVPNPINFPTGCKFHPRCPVGKDDKRCQTCEPNLRRVAPDHDVACWYAKGYEDAPETDKVSDQ